MPLHFTNPCTSLSKKRIAVQRRLSHLRSSGRKKCIWTSPVEIPRFLVKTLRSTRIVVPQVNMVSETHNLLKSFPSHHPAESINSFPESSGYKEGKAYTVGYWHLWIHFCGKLTREAFQDDRVVRLNISIRHPSILPSIHPSIHQSIHTYICPLTKASSQQY